MQYVYVSKVWLTPIWEFRKSVICMQNFTHKGTGLGQKAGPRLKILLGKVRQKW